MTDDGRLGLWWDDLRATALVGTARREPPEWPDVALEVSARPGADRETVVLDGAALGAALRSAGRQSGPGGAIPSPAPDEPLELAAPRAAQLLSVLLAQRPVGPALRDKLIEHWCLRAADARCVIPPEQLVAFLDLATAQPQLRTAARRVLGSRGSWLAARRATWRWAVSAEPGETFDAERLTDDGFADVVRAGRAHDAAAGRALLEREWDSLPAKRRAAGLRALQIGIGMPDEELLERCLDDRSKAVREAAADVLDLLPESRRGRRMAQRLTPLLAVQGMLRKKVTVALPDDPDDSGVRDGLIDPGPGRSRRGYWLQRIIRGAPLSVWTSAGAKPAAVAASVEDADALVGLVAVATDRQDVEWAQALLQRRWSTGLLGVLPPATREHVMSDRLQHTELQATLPALATLAVPWSEPFARKLLGLVRGKAHDHVRPFLVAAMTEGLPSTVLPEMERWLESLDADDKSTRTAIRDLLQFRTLLTSIDEVFR